LICLLIILVFLLFGCCFTQSLFIPESSLNAWAWLSNSRELCLLDFTTGDASSCSSLQDSFNMGVTGVITKGIIFISGQNYSSPTIPWMTIAVDPSQVTANISQILWSTTISPGNYGPIMTTYSSVQASAMVMAGDNGYTWLVNSTQENQIIDSGEGFQGSFDTTLQSYWSVDSSNLYQTNMVTRRISTNTNSWNVVSVAAAQKSSQVYALAQAADATLLYSFNILSRIWNFIGVVKGVAVVPYSASFLDSTEESITFLANAWVGSPVQIVTISVVDASLLYNVNSPDTAPILLQSL